ncbi:hypothetical protein GPECTOR_5g97 [Gonium pectorale]|uniref:Histidine kinase/HSP90-like ATPase domain-containing protein n=1 Tax=Gonium pectorale TaxID=33097 RepID=A0A150GXB2_GONPE|nr:hypothetical protein GPECTOR_5g97 [Gonium pectorale]|eukprot:KXZ54445.1 hypothetical protein GPECTOR_5g97 [Gonium pectorale]
MELIDNAAEATMHRGDKGQITFEIDFDAEDGPTLTVEDNGKGMTFEQLRNYARMSYTTSRIPDIPRDDYDGPLPLRYFINRKLNRYGRGSAATAPKDSLQPSRAYMSEFNYGQSLRDNSWALEGMWEKEQVVVEDDLDGWTIIRIRQLRPDVLKELGDKQRLEKLARQLNQAYHFFLHGMSQALWDALPKELTNGCDRPTGGLSIHIKATADRKTFFDATLGPGEPTYVSDLQKVFSEFEELSKKNNNLLKPCVSYLRYMPPGPAGQPNVAQPGRTPKAAGSRSGRGSARRSDATARDPGGNDDDDCLETDIDTRPKDATCDFIVVWLYFPYASRSYVFPFWSGKVMIKSKLLGQMPDILKEAVRQARADQEAQSHFHKLEDPGRLVALLLVTPDALAHQHKSDFEGRSYEVRGSPSDRVGTEWRDGPLIFEQDSDDEGQLVDPIVCDAAELDLEEPIGFDLAANMMKEWSDKYALAHDAEPLVKGEMLIRVDLTKAQAKREEGEDGRKSSVRRVARLGRIVEKFKSEGNDFAKQHFAIVRPWRPHWSPKAALISESIMELQPVLPERPKRDILRHRQEEQHKLVKQWEDFLPHRLVVRQDAQQGLHTEYDVNHGFDTISVMLASAGSGGSKGKGSKGAQREGAADTTAKPADLVKTAYHFAYRAHVTMIVERCRQAEGVQEAWEQCACFQDEGSNGTYTFSGFACYARAPGKYRLRFEVDEGENEKGDKGGVYLLDPNLPLEHRFEVPQ